MDLKGVGVSQFWKVKDFVQSAAQVSSNNYPETMGKFYVVCELGSCPSVGYSRLTSFVPFSDQCTMGFHHRMVVRQILARRSDSQQDSDPRRRLPEDAGEADPYREPAKIPWRQVLVRGRVHALERRTVAGCGARQARKGEVAAACKQG